MQVLVTGGCGFVGSFVAARFARDGHAVLAVDRRPRALDRRHRAPEVEVATGDVTDRRRTRELVEGHRAEVVVHTAALIGQQRGADDPAEMFAVNVEGTLAVLEAARAIGARVVALSTATLYGIRPDLRPLSEEERPEPVGLYDTTKLMAETLALTYHKVYGLDVVTLRPGYVYGPDNSTGGYFLERAFAGESIDQPIGGDLPLDPTYVRDLVEGIYLAATVRPLRHRLFNITGGVLRHRREVAAIARELVPGARIKLGPGVAEGAHLRGPSDLTRAREELGYEPRFTLEEGMRDWLAWLEAGKR